MDTPYHVMSGLEERKRAERRRNRRITFLTSIITAVLAYSIAIPAIFRSSMNDYHKDAVAAQNDPRKKERLEKLIGIYKYDSPFFIFYRTHPWYRLRVNRIESILSGAEEGKTPEKDTTPVEDKGTVAAARQY